LIRIWKVPFSFVSLWPSAWQRSFSVTVFKCPYIVNHELARRNC
jgi:hypothetical protein